MSTQHHRRRPGAEERFQNSVLELARYTGWLVYHTLDSRGSAFGYPDLTLVHAARKQTLFRELKAAGGRLKPEQRYWLEQLTQAGQDAAVWTPDDWGVIETTLGARDPARVADQIRKAGA